MIISNSLVMFISEKCIVSVDDKNSMLPARICGYTRGFFFAIAVS